MVYHMLDEFPFPSNGMAQPKSVSQAILLIKLLLRFHSLQTGRHSQSHIAKRRCGAKFVSIPFKREGIAKVYRFSYDFLDTTEFQFPSNGKAQPKRMENPVSIPTQLTEFPFPSNGMAQPKHWQRTKILRFASVSIPFKRDGIAKVKRSSLLGGTKLSFNSLQTGTRSQSP